MWQKVKNKYHLLGALSSNIWFGNPSKSLTMIGVTGTDGKTTTASLIYHILKESGKKVAAITTVGAYIGDKAYDVGFHVTTPSSWQLQKLIKKVSNEFARGSANRGSSVVHENFLAANARKGRFVSNHFGANSRRENFVNSLAHDQTGILILEVTSHALDQYRVAGIHFDIGVLTNVTHEHLDYHKTYEKYVATKLRLLESAKVAVVNRDDTSFGVISNQIPNFKKIITYGIKNNSDINLKTFPFKTNLIGQFNTYNCLAAIAVCRTLGLEDEEIRKAIESFEPPVGRQQVVFDKEFKVMIDFAHTPNAFDQILPSIKKITHGRLIHVFGAAGERDASKRPLMGEAAARFDDVIILTAEDPRKESIEKINKEIESGIRNHELWVENSKLLQPKTYNLKPTTKYLFEIPDRREAIEFAVSLAQKGDTVLFTGKSHEKSMNLGHGEEPWDEFEAVEESLKRIKNYES